MKTSSLKVMGILNATPDSFYDKGQFFNLDAAIARGLDMFQQGADLIDIGGESSRPGAPPVSQKEELSRVIPVIKALKKSLPIPLSIDTTKPEVAKAAIDAGASLLNDVSGLRDPAMVTLAKETNVTICLMHMQGSPQTMQEQPHYPNGVVEDLLIWFKKTISHLIHLGIREKQIILDPGIGFGKTVDDNYIILHNLRKFKELGFPLLVGLSRKSFMAKVLEKSSSELLAATLTMNTAALLNGADIIRVHDVREHRDCVDVIKKFLQSSNESNPAINSWP